MPDLLDAYQGDPIMAPAFAGMVSWAFKQPGMRAAYEEETGAALPSPPRTPLDAMIDDATGVTDDYIMGFARWAYDNLWGDEETGEEPDG